jgi:uncharacterized protein YjbJ (UPF0337 family)
MNSAPAKGTSMHAEHSWHMAQGAWEKAKGSIRQSWGAMTDDDIAECNGSREVMIGKVMQRQGVDLPTATKQVDNWLKAL